ncbi:MAG: type II toxin-antitoxin system VapC family toxin [Planctomycetaceae bacterium]
MRYVLDSNVALKWVLAEPDSPQAQRLRGGFQKQNYELMAPDVFPVEVAHALAKAERRNLISPRQGMAFLMDVLSTPPRLISYLPLLPRAFTIATQARIGVYDCLYVALAEREGCELLTADDRLVRVLRPLFPSLTPLSSLP